MHKSLFFKKIIRSDFVVIDSSFPQKVPLGFRNAEINDYFTKIDNFESYTMHEMSPGPLAWFSHGYGVSENIFIENKAAYSTIYPENSRRIKYLDPNHLHRFKLAYLFFLAETYVALPFLEKNKIPFIFVLYPGGGFGLENSHSDAMLTRIFSSKYFKGVIVTQDITKQYLLRKKMCSADKIEYIYGGFVQFKKNELKPKKLYMRDKSTFDICFVAAKYTELGLDKGYDLFIEAAKELCKTTDDIMFHVVGGFGRNEIEIGSIRERIKFYGYRQPDFLIDMYKGMDIFLSPNRPGKIFKGNFDGFPLGIDASYCGVALFVADELNMNHYYKNNEEIVIVPLDSKEIAKVIMGYYNNLKHLYDLSRSGQLVTHKLFDMNYQINMRIEVFKKHVNLKMRAE